jgi:hypothetical protein
MDHPHLFPRHAFQGGHDVEVIRVERRDVDFGVAGKGGAFEDCDDVFSDVGERGKGAEFFSRADAVEGLLSVVEAVEFGFDGVFGEASWPESEKALKDGGIQIEGREKGGCRGTCCDQSVLDETFFCFFFDESGQFDFWLEILDVGDIRDIGITPKLGRNEPLDPNH